MSRFRFPLLVVLGALLASGLIACGGSDEDPQKVLDETFEPGKDYSSGIVAVDFKLSATGTEAGSLDATVKGPFESAEGGLPKFDLDADISLKGAGQDLGITAGLTSTGDAAFVNVQDTDYEVDKGTFQSFKQLFLGLQGQSEKQGDSGINPATFLTDLSNDGTEDVEGTETVHISGESDVNKLIDSVKAAAGSEAIPGQQQLDQLRNSVKESTFDIYSSTDDHRLQKLTSHVVFEPAPSAGASGADTITIDFGITFSDLGQPQTISAPASAEPLSKLLQQYGIDLGGLAGALGAAGAGGGGGKGTSAPATPTPTPPSAGQSSDYLSCLQQARGQDAIQACAEKLQ